MDAQCFRGNLLKLEIASFLAMTKQGDCFVPRNDVTTHNNFYKHLLYVIKLLHYAF